MVWVFSTRDSQSGVWTEGVLLQPGITNTSLNVQMDRLSALLGGR